MTLTPFTLTDVLRTPTGVHRWVSLGHDTTRDDRHRDSGAPTAIAPDTGAEIAAWLTDVAADVEDWILRAHITARVPVPRLPDPVTGELRVAPTPRLWANLPAVARSVRRTVVAPDPWALLFLADLDTWYQALQHGSPRAATVLQQRHQALGFPVTVGDLGSLLTVEFAHTTRDLLLQAYRGAHASTGIGTPAVPRLRSVALVPGAGATETLCA